MIQPRFGFAYDVKGDAKNVVRGNAGLYYARIPGLNLASSRSTDGSRGQTLFRSDPTSSFLGLPPAYGDLLAAPTTGGLPARRVRVRHSFTVSIGKSRSYQNSVNFPVFFIV